ncbi:hypothetical protein ABZ370_11490 [Streptomyces sp. NPDC005962]|uniref:hypothetical protein n=1 Tax=Streptomyces sp. NPDC005962 TaxID=3154466 RepID=UPI00340A7D67
MRGAAGPGGAADEENTTSKPPLLVDDVGGRLKVNGSTDDRSLAPLILGMRSTQDAAGDGSGFSGP